MISYTLDTNLLKINFKYEGINLRDFVNSHKSMFKTFKPVLNVLYTQIFGMDGFISNNFQNQRGISPWKQTLTNSTLKWRDQVSDNLVNFGGAGSETPLRFTDSLYRIATRSNIPHTMKFSLISTIGRKWRKRTGAYGGSTITSSVVFFNFATNGTMICNMYGDGSNSSKALFALHNGYRDIPRRDFWHVSKEEEKAMGETVRNFYISKYQILLDSKKRVTQELDADLNEIQTYLKYIKPKMRG